ncbi:sensor histidine kinase [Mariprofundus aestuarium]|nr:HAMP domain-containing sensor histidine kinase [Mariprofundus aestuarium]
MTLAGLKEHMTEQHKVLDEIHTEGIDECIVENASRELVIKLRFMQEEYSTVGFRKLVSAIDITREYNLDKMKSYFMSVASHELRTPLSSICGFSELLLECPDSFTADEQKQMMLSIHSQSNVLASIVSQLLDVSRIESGEPMQSDMQVRKLDLAHFLEGVVSCLPSAEREAREINLDVIDSCAVLGDEGFLTRVFSNLLSNACKYSSIDSVVSVRVSSVRKGGRSMGLVEVIDQGIGMSPGEVAKAFEKFYRADASGKIKGMGLGLHIVKELVQAMGGSIEMSSQKHIGTTVRVYLPDGKGEL